MINDIELYDEIPPSTVISGRIEIGDLIEDDIHQVILSEEIDVNEVIQGNTTNKTLTLDSFFPEFAGRNVRITPDGLISITDVIKILSGVQNPRKIVKELLADIFPAVSLRYGKGCETYDNVDMVDIGQYGIKSYKFPGARQNTTLVAELKILIEIIMGIRSPQAQKYKRRFAEVLTRHLQGGSVTHR